MTILVTGATSQIGYFLLPMLSGYGETVIGLSRKPQLPPMRGIRWAVGALPHAPHECEEADEIISFGPIDALAQWLAETSVACRALVAISSMSAESKLESCVDSERRTARRLQAGETALAEACQRRGIRWTVLRPTLIYGAGLDQSLTPIARRAAKWRVFPFPNASGIRQPVHAMDVADAATRALRTPVSAGRVLSLGGGERLSVGEMFRRVRRSLPVSTVPIALPGGLLTRVSRLHPSLQGPLSRLEQDLVADNTEATRLLGVRPRPFEPTEAAWGFRTP